MNPRVYATAALALAFSACASTDVALLDGEDGGPAGAVVVLDPKTEAERGELATANTRANAAARRVSARRADPRRYASITGALPQRPALFRLYFPEGSTTLTPESETELQKVLAEVARRSGAELQVTGHTDTTDDGEANDRLSRQRAQEVAQILQARGVQLEVTRVVGRGERELLIPTPDETNEPRNRRVEITVR